MFIATQQKCLFAPLGATCDIALLTERGATWALSYKHLAPTEPKKRCSTEPKKHLAPKEPHSYRSAFSGFTREARRAGR